MSRREAWLTAGGIALLALVARAIAAGAVVFPIPEDTAYYFGVARNLVDGRGLVSDALWSFQTPPLVLPHPAFVVWLPLPSLLAAIPMALIGPTFRAAQVMPVLVGATLPVLAWRLAWDVSAERGLPAGRARVVAVGTGVTAAVELPLLLHSTLPDSTALFGMFVLAACLLMARILGDPRGAGVHDWRLLALGVCLGLGALTRNEAAWLAGTWVALVAWQLRGKSTSAAGSPEPTRPGSDVGTRPAPGPRLALGARLVLIPGVVAFAIFAPWMIRDWIVFGSPLPGQALANALSVTGFDIFAWHDPPTLSRYLAQGVSALLRMRVEGFVHNLFSVLLLPSFPVGILGLVALPWFGGGRVLRPLLIVSVVTFTITTLLFPVSTTWGTYLHAAAATHVLLIVVCLLALDAAIVRIGRVRGWTRPVAWLGPALTTFVAIVFSLVLLPGFGAQSREIGARYTALAARLAATGHPIATLGPVISDFPIWFAEGERSPALALPDESPASVLSLARAFPGTHLLVISSEEHGRWPGVLTSGDPNAACFHEIDLGQGAGSSGSSAGSASTASDPLKGTRVFELTCP